MRSRQVFHVVDSHTEGMPTRVVTGGVGVLPGDSMAQRRQYFLQHRDWIRTLLMTEPRGHAAMSGAILQPPVTPGADAGVVFIEVSGCLPMCGHGTIGVATVLVETGMVEVVEPETVVRLDTPAGPVSATVRVRDGVAESVTIRNVPSYCDRLGASIEVPGYGHIDYDLAFGGNFYAIVDLESTGIAFDRALGGDIISAGMAVMDAIAATDSPRHRDDPAITGLRHVMFVSGDSTAGHTRNAMVIHPGWFDRSPCGTGTSARMAQLYARGELGLDTDMVSESFLGTHFVGRLVEHTTVAGRWAVVPTITGRAWITGTAQYLLDPTDPFPAGFTL